MMKISKKREAGEILGRGGISQRILDISKNIVENGSYKNAIEQAGRISVLVQAATFDQYWDEKTKRGINSEEGDLLFIIEDEKKTK